MRAARKRLPLLMDVEPIGKNKVRLFFQSDKVVEIALPWVRYASLVEVVDEGMGLGLGDGRDVAADLLATMRGKVVMQGRPGWVGSPKRRARRKKGT